MKTALLIIDATPDFMPKGPFAVTNGDQIIDPIRKLMVEGGFDETVDVHDWHPANHQTFAANHNQAPFTQGLVGGELVPLWPTHGVQGTEGALMHPKLREIGATMVQEKGLRPETECLGAFNYHDGVPTGLRLALRKRKIDQVVVVGLATEYCVKEAAVQAIRNGFAATVVLEGCRGVDNPAGTVAAAIKEMEAEGVTIVPTVDAFFKMRAKELELENRLAARQGVAGKELYV